MKIQVLGTRAQIKDSKAYHSKHSGVLIDDKILLDLGEKEFLDYDPELILITHLHPDHAFFVGKDKPNFKTNAECYAPESYKNFSIVKKKITKFTFQDYIITPIPTIHSKLVKSQAYLVEKGNDKILYTGDIVWIEKEYWRLFSNVCAVITDGSYLRKGGMVKKDKDTGQLFGHTGIPNLINLFSDKTSLIIFVHLGTWFYKISSSEACKQIKNLVEDDKLKIIVAYDKQIIEI